jgi:hypothetical protein
MKKLVALVVACVLVVCAYAQKKTVYKTYSDKQKGYTIKYPSNWNNKTAAGAEFFLYRPVEEPGQKFMENMNLVTGPTEDMYLVEYVKSAEEKMKKEMPDFKIIGGGYGKIGSLDAFQMFYTFSARNGKYKLHNVLYIMVKDDKAYNLTGSALESTFNRFLPIFDTMSNSFRITKPPSMKGK